MKQASIQPNQKWPCEHSPVGEGEGRSIKFEFGPSNQTKCQSTLILLAILGVLLVNKSSPKSQVIKFSSRLSLFIVQTSLLPTLHRMVYFDNVQCLAYSKLPI